MKNKIIVDIIIISATINERLKKITQNAINSCINSENNVLFNILVIETFDKNQMYENCNTVYFIEEKFNYNRTVNYGLSITKNQYVGFFNNDIEFKENWFTNLQKYFDIGYKSLSPFCQISLNKDLYKKEINEGYKVRLQLTGWAIVINRDILKIIGKLNEDCNFWRSDDIYGQQLKLAGIKHALVANSIVNHLHNGSNTLAEIDSNLRQEFTHGQFKKYKTIKTINKYKFSIIMPSYLEQYNRAATNREEKFIRAVTSVIKQSFNDYELIIISDGCEKTVNLYKKYFIDYENIKCFQIPKQELFSGTVRQVGLNKAIGEYIIYLDSDDFYGVNHLKIINENLKDFDWIYFNDKLFNEKDCLSYDNAILNKDKAHLKEVELRLGSSGTSSICHKRLLNVSWAGCNGYAHDMNFIKKLMQYQKYKKLEVNSEYYICHTVSSGINS